MQSAKTDKTACMYRLIQVFAGRTSRFCHAQAHFSENKGAENNCLRCLTDLLQINIHNLFSNINPSADNNLNICFIFYQENRL